MKSLVVEEDFSCRKTLQAVLQPLGEATVAINGRQAIEAFREAQEQGSPFDLICLDAVMPEPDGHEVLRQIREYERTHGITAAQEAKVIMTTSPAEPRNALPHAGGEAYLTKPVNRSELVRELQKFRLVGK